MSALGQKQTYAAQKNDVRFTPDRGRLTTARRFNLIAVGITCGVGVSFFWAAGFARMRQGLNVLPGFQLAQGLRDIRFPCRALILTYSLISLLL